MLLLLVILMIAVQAAALRHETYHFTVSRKKGLAAVRAINWAEELHEALGLFIERHVDIDGIYR